MKINDHPFASTCFIVFGEWRSVTNCVASSSVQTPCPLVQKCVLCLLEVYKNSLQSFNQVERLQNERARSYPEWYGDRFGQVWILSSFVDVLQPKQNILQIHLFQCEEVHVCWQSLLQSRPLKIWNKKCSIIVAFRSGRWRTQHACSTSVKAIDISINATQFASTWVTNDML